MRDRDPSYYTDAHGYGNARDGSTAGVGPAFYARLRGSSKACVTGSI